jgi:hypothetical protein
VLQKVEPPEFLDSLHMKVVKLFAPSTGRLYPPGHIPGTHFSYRLSRSQGHSAAGRIKSMRNKKTGRYFKNTLEKLKSKLQPNDGDGYILESRGNNAICMKRKSNSKFRLK